MNGIEPAKKRYKSTRSASAAVRNSANKVEQRIALFKARDAGYSINESARIAGIAKMTAAKWLRARVDTKETDAANLLSKHEARGILAKIARADETAPRDRTEALKQDAALQGWNAIQRSEVTVRSSPQSVIAWLSTEPHKALTTTPERHSLPASAPDNTQPAQLVDSNDSAGLHTSRYRTLDATTHSDAPCEVSDAPPASPKAVASDIDQGPAQHSQNSDKSEGSDG